MNFPHDNRDRAAADDAAAVPVPFANHQALLARIIARQASSPSAQDFGAASQRLRGAQKAARSSFLEERMAFFAGRIDTDPASCGKPSLFRTGCFRPDLAQRELDKMHR